MSQFWLKEKKMKGKREEREREKRRRELNKTIWTILDDVANGTDSRRTARGADSFSPIQTFLSRSLSFSLGFSCPWRPSQVLPKGQIGGASSSAATPFPKLARAPHIQTIFPCSDDFGTHFGQSTKGKTTKKKKHFAIGESCAKNQIK
jgi:hypothetical protein